MDCNDGHRIAAIKKKKARHGIVGINRRKSEPGIAEMNKEEQRAKYIIIRYYISNL